MLVMQLASIALPGIRHRRQRPQAPGCCPDSCSLLLVCARCHGCRWNPDLEGVLLSFRNERVLTQAATIHPYFPFVRLDVAAEVVVFRPRPGMRLGA